jgi:arylsulfatase
MYVAYTAAHWPMHARQRDIKKYAGWYDEGYAPVRKARLKKMKELGVVRQNAKMSPMAGDWDKVPDKLWESACMEVYAAMVDQMDQGIGRIVQTLKDTGQLDNTLICFFQDNGGCAEAGGRSEKGPLVLRAPRPTLDPIPDDVIHYTGSFPAQTRDGYPVRRGHVMPGPSDTYIGYGKGWANVSNTPHREYKHWVHEGGISTPFIVHWPAGIEAKNALRHEPSHLIDLMATAIDLSGATYPKQFKGEAIQPMEGRSLVPVFNGRKLDREAIYWEHEGNRAVRVGDYKLVSKGRNGKWELYNIKKDRSELNDLSAEMPEKAKKLETMWMTYAKRTGVIPYPSNNRR